MEGGALRGLFTAGVTDVMMENGISFDGAIGVSAGAAFGCNYKSNQPGRVLRYNTTYCKDPRYSGWSSLIKTGDIYGADFCYREIPTKLDIFDSETFAASPMEFYVVATDVETGKAVYKSCKNGDEADLEWIRASASIPMVSRVVEIEGLKLLDGGISDSVPLKYFESIGYDKNIVILTQPEGFIKKKNSLFPLLKFALKKHPLTVKALANRHIDYNETMKYISEREKSGDILVIRPPVALEISPIAHDPEKMREIYAIGRETASKELNRIKEFIK